MGKSMNVSITELDLILPRMNDPMVELPLAEGSAKMFCQQCGQECAMGPVALGEMFRARMAGLPCVIHCIVCVTGDERGIVAVVGNG